MNNSIIFNPSAPCNLGNASGNEHPSLGEGVGVGLQASSYKKGQPRWCPGCGDHFFLASLHKALAEIGVAPKDIAVISGIGCSSRLPHYMATYGMNTIHGRAAAIATGAKVANPNLNVRSFRRSGIAEKKNVFLAFTALQLANWYRGNIAN